MATPPDGFRAHDRAPVLTTDYLLAACEQVFHIVRPSQVEDAR